jgi:catalase
MATLLLRKGSIEPEQAMKTRKPSRSKIDTKQQDLERDVRDADGQFLTTNQGLRINDNQNSLKAGPRGSTLLEDFIFREKITHFDHERIPERIVHARGAAAHGTFQVYESLSRYTKAGFLTDPSLRTPVFVRFSTVAGSRGSSDLARDVRGFAVKFYTQEGNYDLVGNNIPVFFIQDAIKFPDLIHAVKPEPHHEMPQAASAHDTFWDFVSLMPESMHMILWAMSDRAIPRSYRMMEGFGIHTFRLVNAAGKSRFVKFHWKPLLGVHSVAWDEAQLISGRDADFHRRDLWEAIENGDFPEWELGLQIVEEKDEHKFDFDLLDPTKLIPEELVPVRRVGKLTLNRNPDNFFAETEQVAFHPGHVVPGIDFSNDPLLQGRLFSYTDTQLSRLGSPNFHELPINRAVCPVHNLQRDAHMRQTVDRGRVAYEPNTLGGGCPFQAKASEGGFVSHAEKVDAQKVRARSPSFFDHYTQAALFFRSQSEPEQDHIIDALRFELGKLEVPAIRERVVYQLAQIDAGLAKRVADGLGLRVPTKVSGPVNGSIPADGKPQDFQSVPKKRTLAKSAALSMANTIKDTVKTRKVAILAADGVDGAAVAGIKKALEAAGAQAKVIGPRLGSLKTAGGALLTVDASLMTVASVLFDAVYVPDGERSIAALKGDPDAIRFVNEAYRHCKPLASTGVGYELLVDAIAGMPENLLQSDEAIVMGKDQPVATVAKAFIRAIARHRNWARPVKAQDPPRG